MRRLSILLVLLLLVFCTNAQDKVSKNYSNVKGGVRVGLATSQISGDDLEGFHQFGVYAGGYALFPLSQNWKWMVQPELNFNMKGSHTYYPKGMDAYSQTYSLRLCYLEVPVMFKWDCYKGIIIEAGPQFGVNVYHREKINGDVDEHVQAFRWWEFSYVVGLSYILKEHYGFYFRYTGSFIPVRVPDNVYNRLQNKQFNSVMMFGFYYQF